jgi:hypothetical protein
MDSDSDSKDTKVKKGQTTSERVEIIIPSYDKCCMRGYKLSNLAACGPTSHSKLSFSSRLIYICMLIDYPTWSPLCVSFASLGDIDIRSYLKRKNVISKIEEDDLIVNEKNLIANRLRFNNIFIDDSMYICPKHRSSYGIDWCVAKGKCYHPDHDPKRHPSKGDLRPAKIALWSKIEGFPVGGK